MNKFYLSLSRYLTALLILVTSVAWSQSRTVSGKVTSADDGTGIPGVNVVEKGTNNGTATDVDGNYSLNVGDNSTLVFSFVGYTGQEVNAGTQTSINIALESDVTSLSEVVVVGYGTQEKKEITGSVVSLDSKDFNKGNINDPTQLLQGKVAGLSIYNKGGDPNANPVIRLRGLSTVGSNVQPLVVVDGVLGASLDNIDPNDIESINVLKDGSAAAIYGSRGSSGVILVTTKKGSRAGGLSVNYNAYVSAASIFKKVPVMSASQYVAAGGNDLGAVTDWQEEVTQTGITNVHNLSVSGGNQTTTFRMSANVRNVNGILKYSGWDQINTRANLTHTALEGKLNIDLNMAFTNRNSDFAFNEAFRYATLYNPTAPITFPNGEYYQAILFDNYNPVAILEQNVNEGKRKNLNYSAKIDYNITKNLTWTVNYAQQFDDVINGTYFSSNSLYAGYGRNGLARRYISDKTFTLFETYGTYAKTFSRIDLSLSGGYSYQQDQFQDLNVELGNFPSDALGYNSLQNAGDRISGIASNVNISSGRTPINKIIAGFARVNLSFDNGIFFNASVRKEGSTKLGPDHQWGTFPSVGAGVDLNKYLQIPSVSLLKLRAGYGVTGSLPGPSGLSQDQYNYSLNGGGNVTLAVNGNKDLKWEQKAETNIGLEFGLGKLTGTLDVYSRTIKDFILLRNVPVTQYASGQRYENAGSLKTPGIELTLNYNSLQAGDFSWTPGLLLSHYKTTLESFIIDRQVRADFGAPGQNGTYPILTAVGESIGQIWGPVFEGVEGNGAPRFEDLNGDGVVDAAPSDALLPTVDMKVLGNGIPTMELGWTNRLSYKNWDMNVFFRGAFGHSLINQFRAFYEPLDPGAINSYNRIITSKAVPGLTSAQYSSLYVEKADFIKLDNLTIGYTFKTASNLFKGFRLYVSGQNLLQITNYTGIDPEPVLADPEPNPVDVLAPGIDRRNNYFTARTFTFGLNVGF
ncbi:MAG: SusC/RagA family TonB-linked outer membrane protein [Cyclobacteriaceae bacterium]